ncbi:transcription elongation factor GreA [Brevibacterium sp. 50QC2O2]|jgi:transcription elongation factor GreA|uniref:transcription elongation factor GreA n=1 Tax=Brevibacterium TaxID=1696 RepID=UPI00211C0B3E|nr:MULTISPECIES: transcription elongation factor GreA [unclassified Brevibacterium]MCQ9385910.1 transcription elongation factor GreA [Brevibacterium sp. 68QC2CO]MCQ9387424.1 transcription elongation factor GreA [Brevibacterium sp. 50QC2O2]
MTEQSAETTWLSQAAYDRLSKELEELSGPGRQAVAERIEAARDEGDLKENGGYHAARDEQGQLEARIRQLEVLLRNAEVGEADSDTSIVTPGKVVVVTLGKKDRRFVLGSRELAGGGEDVEVFSEKSPLGAAVNGAKVGSTVSYEAPNGRTIEVTIKSAEAF